MYFFGEGKNTTARRNVIAQKIIIAVHTIDKYHLPHIILSNWQISKYEINATGKMHKSSIKTHSS